MSLDLPRHILGNKYQWSLAHSSIQSVLLGFILISTSCQAFWQGLSTDSAA
jgi:hypothetical protein